MCCFNLSFSFIFDCADPNGWRTLPTEAVGWVGLRFKWGFIKPNSVNRMTVMADSFGNCLTLCNPTNYTVHGILQARILESVSIPFSRGSPGQNLVVGTIPFSRGSPRPRDQTLVSRIAGGFFTIWATREAQRMTNLNYLSISSIFASC